MNYAIENFAASVVIVVVIVNISILIIFIKTMQANPKQEEIIQLQSLRVSHQGLRDPKP